MRNLKSPSRATLVAAVAGLITVYGLAAVAKTPQPAGPISYVAGTALKSPPRNALKGKSRAVKIDRRMLRNGRIFLDLPDGTSFEAVRSIQHERGNGKFGWIGRASDDPDSRVIFGVSGDAVAGTFSYHGKLFRLEPRANGTHILSQIKPTDPAPELDPIAVADKNSAAPGAGGNIAMDANGNGSVIDVLVAYTPAVRALYGTAGAEALVLQAVAEANQAYASSGMSTRLNLVQSVQTNYVESGDMTTDLTRLRSTSDGHMDELHALRNTYGADVVSLIENDPQYCGIAYRMTTMSVSFASNAFSVVHHSCATGYYSFAHEIGHNQGAHHDANNASGAIFPYAYGYQDPNNRFRTIMAYNCAGGCNRIGYFSNAEIFYNGVATGSPGVAENADAIDATAATVASFRQSAAQALPTAPSGLGANAVSFNQIDLAWTDRSSNETGYYLDRSTDGLNFSQVAALPANATAYSDNSLSANTVHYYRVRAWNSAGNSNYSNVATAATEEFPVYFDLYASSEMSGGGVVTGTFADTQSRGGAVESIKEVASAGSAQNRYSYLEHYWAIQVLPGTAMELLADVTANAASQTFTFAYSTSPTALANDPAAWVDMFTVSATTGGAKQFTLPVTESGWIYISVRDNNRAKGVTTADAVNIDYLAIRMEIPPGC